MNSRMRKILVIGLCIILFICAIGLSLYLYDHAVRETVTAEYLEHLDKALSDIHRQPDCIEYGLAGIDYEIESCTPAHSVSGKWYVITLRINCQSDMELNKTEKSLLSYAVLNQVPEEFRTSRGHKVSIRNKDASSPFAADRMVYIYLNDSLVNAPEELRPIPGYTKDVICPKCGTGWRSGSVAAKYVAQNGVCSVCN